MTGSVADVVTLELVPVPVPEEPVPVVVVVVTVPEGTARTDVGAVPSGTDGIIGGTW